MWVFPAYSVFLSYPEISSLWLFLRGIFCTASVRFPVISHYLSSSAYYWGMVFKRVGNGRPYPDHGLSPSAWHQIAPRQVRLDELVTTKSVLDLKYLLSKDSTFFGDLFPHVVRWKGELYLEDGLHRTLRAALQQRETGDGPGL